MTATMSSTDELICMAAAIAPEVEFYLLDASDVAAHVGASLDVYGWVVEHNPNLRQLLVDRFEWRGRKPFIVLDRAAMASDASERGWDLAALVRQVFVHELAHLVPARKIPDLICEPPQSFLEKTRREFADFETTVRPRPVPWENHGLAFTRYALHLAWRANAAGWDVPYLGFLCAGWFYSLSGVMSYVAALGDEPQRMAGASFAKIAATDPPVAFTKLFTDDVARYLAQ